MWIWEATAAGSTATFCITTTRAGACPSWGSARNWASASWHSASATTGAATTRAGHGMAGKATGCIGRRRLAAPDRRFGRIRRRGRAPRGPIRRRDRGLRWIAPRRVDPIRRATAVHRGPTPGPLRGRTLDPPRVRTTDPLHDRTLDQPRVRMRGLLPSPLRSRRRGRIRGRADRRNLSTGAGCPTKFPQAACAASAISRNSTWRASTMPCTSRTAKNPRSR